MIVKMFGIDWEGRAASLVLELVPNSPPFVALSLRRTGRGRRRIEVALGSYPFDCIQFDLVPRLSDLAAGTKNLMALVCDTEDSETRIRGDVSLFVSIDTWSVFLTLKPSADPEYVIGLSQMNGRSEIWDVFFTREAVRAFVEASGSLKSEVNRIVASLRDPRDKLFHFPEDSFGYGLVISQGDGAAYAFLNYQKKLVSKVWLFNLDPLPDIAPPDLNLTSPPLPTKWIQSRKVKPIEGEEDVRVEWDPNEGDHAMVFLRNERIAELHRDESIGRSVLVKKDNPHAMRLS